MSETVRKYFIFPLLILGLAALACNLTVNLPPLWEPTSIQSASTEPSLPHPLSDSTQPPVSPSVNTKTPTPDGLMTPSFSGKSIQIKIFLIALEDGGQSGIEIGCGDSVIPVTLEIPYTTGVLRAAIGELLSIEEPYYGESGRYNALYQTQLTVGEINHENGEAIIHLDGNILLGGVCDNPRLQAQLEETALQFPAVEKAKFLVNGIPLEDFLSLR